MGGDRMLASLSMVLKIPDNCDFNFNKTSLFHGVIMETIDSGFAELLHGNGLNPFSSCLLKDNGRYIWNISTLNLEAYQLIIEKFLDPGFKGFQLKHNDISVGILDKTLITREKSCLMEEFYTREADKYFTLHFISPASFKSNGKYIFYPDLELLFRNVMNKYSASSDSETLKDEDTLEQIIRDTKIIKYQLQSVTFSLEGVRIPAFIGKITMRVDGTETMRRFARLLLEYSEYSGIGIKCSLGMGAVRLEKEGNHAR